MSKDRIAFLITLAYFQAMVTIEDQHKLGAYSIATCRALVVAASEAYGKLMKKHGMEVSPYYAKQANEAFYVQGAINGITVRLELALFGGKYRSYSEMYGIVRP